MLFAAGVLADGTTSDRPPALDALVIGWALYYYFAFESSGGQTLGKKLFKLRVLRVDGSPVGMREVAVRTVLRVIDGIGFYLVGLIVMLVTGKRRGRFGDLAAGTMVADASGAVAPASPEPAAVPAPEVPSATITLPARPAPTMSAAAAPAAPEMRPFEPAMEAEPAVEAPVAELAEPEPVAEAPAVQPEDVASSSLRELARDVAEAVAAPSEEEAPAEDGADPDETLTVKSVETVSAIDLVMGSDDAADEAAHSPSADDTQGV